MHASFGSLQVLLFVRGLSALQKGPAKKVQPMVGRRWSWAVPRLCKGELRLSACSPESLLRLVLLLAASPFGEGLVLFYLLCYGI